MSRNGYDCDVCQQTVRLAAPADSDVESRFAILAVEAGDTRGDTRIVIERKIVSHPWDERWVKGEAAGKGGQGLTFVAYSKTDRNQRACLKILKNNSSAEARGRMYREVASLLVLAEKGGNVPRVFDHNTQEFQNAGTELFVVMEFIDGETLQSCVERVGRLQVDVAGELILGLCQTIRIAHEFPLLHRDLKPANIIIRNLDSGDAVIVDYGLSFNADDEDITETNEHFRNKFLDLPETNTPFGNRRDHRSDITAVCGVFYYMLTGHVPGQLSGSDGRPPHMRTRCSIREAIGDDRRVPQLEAIFSRGFTPMIEHRFQTIDEFSLRLESVLQGPARERQDPLELAREISNELRSHDRVTKVQEFANPAQEILGKCNRYFQDFGQKSGRLKIQMSSKGESNVPLPFGLESVPVPTTSVHIHAEHHDECARLFDIRIGARGDECVILLRRGKLVPSSSNSGGFFGSYPTDEQWSDYVEGLCYPGDTEPDIQMLIPEFESWLTVAMTEIRDEALSSGTETRSLQ